MNPSKKSKAAGTQPAATPSPDDIKQARESAGLSQQEAASLVHSNRQATWAEYENGKRNISVAAWELFLIKTGQHAEYAKK